MKWACQDAKDALRKSADLEVPTHFEPHQLGDKVWLEGHNLTTTHPTTKLTPMLRFLFLLPYHVQIHWTASFPLSPILT